MKLSSEKITDLLRDIFDKYFFIINIIVIGAVLAAGYGYVLSPSIMRLRAGQTLGLEDRKKEEERLSQYLNNLEKMRQEFKSLSEEKLDQFRLILPREEDIPGLFVQMQELALRNGFILQAVDISPVVSGATSAAGNGESEEGGKKDAENEKSSVSEMSGGRIKEIVVSFTISEGDYEAFKKFLGDVEKNIRIFDIYDIRFGSAKVGPYSISLRTYYLVL